MEQGFVGRVTELAQWHAALAKPDGQLIVISGAQGFGKSRLLAMMLDSAAKRTDYQCGILKQEATPSDSFSTIAEAIVSGAHAAANTSPGSFSRRRLEQWRALLNVVNLGDLVASLVGEAESRHPREALIHLLENVSRSSRVDARILIAIDTAKYLNKQSEGDWTLFAGRVPPKVKVLVTQRVDDIFGAESALRPLQTQGKVLRIPQGTLSPLTDTEVRTLVAQHSAGSDSTSVFEALAKYQGHPYATAAALSLVGAGVPAHALPGDPTPEGIAGEQWRNVQRNPDGHAVAALKTFESLASLPIAVPLETLSTIAGVQEHHAQVLLADDYLGSLVIRTADNRLTLYHSLLSDHIRAETPPKRQREIRERAVATLRHRMLGVARTGEPPEMWCLVGLARTARSAMPLEDYAALLGDRIGRELLRGGFHHSCEVLLDEVLAELPDASESRIALLIDKGYVLTGRGEKEAAQVYYREACELAETFGDDHQGAVARMNLLGGSGDATADDYIRLRQLFANAGDYDAARLASFNLIHLQTESARFDDAKAALQWARDLPQGNRGGETVGVLDLADARLSSAMGERDRAIQAARQAATTTASTDMRKDAYLELARCLAATGNVTEAASAFLTARGIAIALGATHVESVDDALSDIIGAFSTDGLRVEAVHCVSEATTTLNAAHLPALAWLAVGVARVRDAAVELAVEAFEAGIASQTSTLPPDKRFSLYWNRFAMESHHDRRRLAKIDLLTEASKQDSAELYALLSSLFEKVGETAEATNMSILCQERAEGAADRMIREHARFLTDPEHGEVIKLPREAPHSKPPRKGKHRKKRATHR